MKSDLTCTAYLISCTRILFSSLFGLSWSLKLLFHLNKARMSGIWLVTISSCITTVRIGAPAWTTSSSGSVSDKTLIIETSIITIVRVLILIFCYCHTSVTFLYFLLYIPPNKELVTGVFKLYKFEYFFFRNGRIMYLLRRDRLTVLVPTV